ncbi:MAG TPA: response regulator transcription factor [Balneolales bacterium]|nr:response regulator transcription factor [Balneolales bacterium]
MKTARLLLVDDHKIIRDGIRALLHDVPNVRVVDEAENGPMAISLVKKNHIDVVIMDINIPGMDGIEATRKIKEYDSSVSVIALTMLGEKGNIKAMIEAGASGYILKTAGEEQLVNAIISVMEGKYFFSDEAAHTVMMDMVYEQEPKNKKSSAFIKLTDRELEVLKLIVEEHTTQEIADALFISTRTVDAHRRNLLQKTGARNLAGLVRYALEHGISPTEL